MKSYWQLISEIILIRESSSYKRAANVLHREWSQEILQTITNDWTTLKETKALFAKYQAKSLSEKAFMEALKKITQDLNIKDVIKKSGNDFWLALMKATIKEFSGKNAWKYN